MDNNFHGKRAQVRKFPVSKPDAGRKGAQVLGWGGKGSWRSQEDRDLKPPSVFASSASLQDRALLGLILSREEMNYFRSIVLSDGLKQPT
jgi:hypothetical protein